MSSWRAPLTRLTRTARFSTSAPRPAGSRDRDRDRIKRERDRVQRKPNPTMENDPSLVLLLRDVDNAVKGAKGREIRQKTPPEQYPFYDRVKVADFDVVAPEDEYGDFEELEEGQFDRERKAPAAFIGGIKAKTISLPIPLIVQMEEIVEGASHALR